MGVGVTNIQDDNYPTAASAWIQVSRQGTAKDILHIGLHICTYIFIYIYIYIYIYVLNFISLEIQLSWNYGFHFLFC